MQTQQSKPNKTKCSPVFVKENKSWCISWLSVIRQEVSIDALSWTPQLWALGGLAGLLARLSLQLKIISPRMYLAFIFLTIICSLWALWLPVPSTKDSYEPLEMGEVKRRRIGQEHKSSTQWCRSLTLQDLNARPHAEMTYIHQYTGSPLRSHLHTYTVNQPPNEDQGNVTMSITFFLMA